MLQMKKRHICARAGNDEKDFWTERQMWGTGEQKGQRRERGEQKSLVPADMGKIHVVHSKFAN